MSLVKCAVIKCQNRVREGLVRHGAGNRGHDLADGRICWRCRARQAPRKRDSKVKRP